MRRWATAGAAALLLSAFLAGASPTIARADVCSTEAPTGIESKNVAIVVHGWTGSAMADTRDLLSEQLSASEWIVTTFDYEDANTLWPTSSGAADCLASVAYTWHAATGVEHPNVYIVGHSMGGLMARFAAHSGSGAASQAVGGVVTLDTPHTGSPWGSSRLGELYQALMGTRTPVSDAARCLALHHPGMIPERCDYPPELADTVRIAQIGGDVTLTRTYFMYGRSEVDTLSDGIVWLDSEVGYKKSLDAEPANPVDPSYTVRCSFPWGSLVRASVDNFHPTALHWAAAQYRWATGETANLIQNGSAAITNDLNAWGIMAAVAGAAPCGHSGIVSNPEAIAATAAYLNDWANASAELHAVKTAPAIDPDRFCHTLYERPSVYEVTEIVGYTWDEVRWRVRTDGIGVPRIYADPEAWVLCNVAAGGMAPPYEFETLTEFWPVAADAYELYKRRTKSTPDGENESVIPLAIEGGEGRLVTYNGEGRYSSGATAYAVRGNVWVSVHIHNGILIGRRLGWPDDATLTLAATEVIEAALSGYAQP